MTLALLANVRRKVRRPVERLALVTGDVFSPVPRGPRTLIEALLATAQTHPTRGIHFVTQRRETVQTYPILLKKALRVAAGLQEFGLRPGDRIILQLDNLRAHFPAFWGGLLAGVAPVTVAIAPTYKERNGIVNKLINTWSLLEHPLIVTTRRLAPALAGLAEDSALSGLKFACIEDLVQSGAKPKIHSAQTNEVAFLQLSSGSTGVPKCIQETHAGIIAHIQAARLFNHYGLDERTLNWLPLDHVVPILTFHLRDVCLGYDQIHVQPEIVLSDPLAWLDLLDTHHVTQTWAPNFGFKLVSDRLNRNPGKNWDLSAVKFFMNAGEQVTLPVLRAFLEAVAPYGVPQRAMQPAFGMAEVCTCMTYANDFSLATGAQRFLKSSLDGVLQPASANGVDTVEFVSLGRPVPGVSIRIADSQNRLVPEDVIGRLQIKGEVVTPGYLNNPEANAEAFVGNGWFNSGDLGFIHNGELFLTGREKEMIIVRGAKFYCYEIEDVVNQVEGVQPTFAAACSTLDPAVGTEHLAVFFVPEPAANHARISQEIRTTVSARLGITPRFIVPLARDTFPKTTSGKIQRTQLKKGLETGAFNEFIHTDPLPAAGGIVALPTSATEAKVAGLWQEVLGFSPVPVDCSLFALGGDSLKAIQIVSRVREAFQLEFPLAALFEEDATVQNMARWIEEAHQRGVRPGPPAIGKRQTTPEAPASSSQLRIWLADQMQPGTAMHNICRSITLSGPLDIAALEQALAKLIHRHEALRTNFFFDRQLVQRIGAPGQSRLSIDDLTNLTPAIRKSEADARVQQEANRTFDLASGPLFRSRLLKFDNQEHLLLVTFHQIVVDGWSIPIFYRELSELYRAAIEGRPDTLPPLPVQYADFAVWQTTWANESTLANQFAYWKDRLTLTEPEIRLRRPAPLEATNGIPKPNQSNFHLIGKDVIALKLDCELVSRVRDFNTREGYTFFATLLAAYKALLHRWSGSDDIMVGCPAAGRNRLEIEGLIGFFVNSLLLRTRIATGLSFRQLVKRVQETSAGAFAHSEAPFERLIQKRPKASPEHRRWFQFWFAPIDPQWPFQMGPLQAEPRIVFPQSAQFDLSLFISETPQGLVCYFEHLPQVPDHGAIDAFVTEFDSSLHQWISEPDRPI